MNRSIDPEPPRDSGPWHIVQLLLLGVALGVVLYAGYLFLPMLAFE